MVGDHVPNPTWLTLRIQVPNLRRYDWTFQTYITVPPITVPEVWYENGSLGSQASGSGTRSP